MASSFDMDLQRFGPAGAAEPVDRAWAHRYCMRLARGHYENFSVASLLLPRHLLRHFHAVYAFCRWADDLADETGGGPRALQLLTWWRSELLRCYHGQATHPVFVALSETVHRFDIPPDPFLDLLRAFEQDLRVHSYRTYTELLGYCQCSANPVGHLVLYLSGCFDSHRAVLADHVCTALQLANFWQDVARDLDIGRVYLPEDDQRKFGYSPDDLHQRRFTPAFAELMRFEVDRTRDLFYRGQPLLDLVPSAVRADVDLFIRGGLAILRKIEAADYDVWSRRPVLQKWEKGVLLAGALWRRLQTRLRV